VFERKLRDGVVELAWTERDVVARCPAVRYERRGRGDPADADAR
jgi:hypothetical protein